MSERLTLDASVEELEDLAVSRARAIGRPVVVVAFTGSGRARVLDIDPGGLIDQGSVSLGHPSPGAADRLPPSDEAA